MVIFGDTSAFYAYLDADDGHHEAVRGAWAGLVQRDEGIVTSNHVITETLALCQSRLGLSAMRQFLTNVVPALRVHWIGQELHDAAGSALLAAGRRGLSFVDCTSFAIMRRQGIRRALTLDRHFAEQGFECLPRGFTTQVSEAPGSR